jgi:hypothetical protein
MAEVIERELASELAPLEPAPSPGATDDQASSSGADQGETRESLLEAVQRAVPELRRDAEEDADGSDGASPAQVARNRSDDDPDLPDEVTQAELAKYSKSATQRIKKLNAQRQKSAADVQRLTQRLSAIESSANAADQVTKYLNDHDISREDFLFVLEMAAAMRQGDFPRFHAGVKPYMRLAEEYLGITLPNDLQERVNQGHMTTQAAALFSRERMDRAMAQTNAQRQQLALQQHQVASTQQQQQWQKENLAVRVRDTVDAWEAKIARSDPDYAAKKPAVQNTMWAVVREQGIPQSPEHAVQIAQEALRRVNAQYRAWAPQRRPTMRTPSSTGRTAGVSSEPTSLLEAVRFAREGASR